MSVPAVDMDAIIAAANEEGQVNLIALPPTWANYEGVIAAFNEKYPDIETPVQQPGRVLGRGARRRRDPARPGHDARRPRRQPGRRPAGGRPRRSGTRTCRRRGTRSPRTSATRTATGSRAYYGVMAFGVNTTLFTRTCRRRSPTCATPAYAARCRSTAIPARPAPRSPRSWPRRSPTAGRSTTSCPASSTSPTSPTAGILSTTPVTRGDGAVGRDADRASTGATTSRA